MSESDKVYETEHILACSFCIPQNGEHENECPYVREDQDPIARTAFNALLKRLTRLEELLIKLTKGKSNE